MLKASWSLCYYLSPLMMLILYRRGMFHAPDGPPYLAKMMVIGIGIYYFAHITRGVGRMSNSAYKTFASELRQVRNGQLPKSTIAKYDFSFDHWPVDYSLKNSRSHPVMTVRERDRGLSTLDRIKLLPLHIISYLAAHSFGRWMIYPGSTALLNTMIGPALIEGRTKLIENYDGRRYKLETYEGNHLDTMFIDRRHSGTDNGSILVITSEGNAAFYEAGCNEAPLTRGFSVLGWNHPGFGSSTGKPHPDQEFNGIDTVVQFAINVLNFPVEQIVFFSWSIGGFSASWAAANYPDCKAVILDATFDDLLPLARNKMPRWMDTMVELTVRDHFNLNNADWLHKYNGPVRLIRRTQDEMISLDPVDVRTNRGNFLLISLLQRRYPNIVNNDSVAIITRWLGFTEIRKVNYLLENNVDSETCHAKLLELSEKSGDTIPMLEGEELEQEVKNQLSLYLADMHMSDMVSTHCVPLPAMMFELPWQLK